VRPAPGLVAAILACLGVIGCAGPGPVPSGGPSRVPSPVPSALPATVQPAASATATVQPASPSPGGVTLDGALLDLLPTDIDGREVILEEPAFAEATSDPAFAASVDRAAFFVVVDEADLASGVVAHLRPGVYSDAFFRDWRDSYDEGACGQAGGVAGNAEAELGGRTVHITSCAGGLLVYHAYLPERDVATSVISVGEARFGEQLMAGLAP
jgi:hypothetical protein